MQHFIAAELEKRVAELEQKLAEKRLNEEGRDRAVRELRKLKMMGFTVEGKVIVEFDGAVKYDGATGREALVSEKVREDALRALGYRIVRIMWADLNDPAAIRAKVLQALHPAA